MMMIYIVVMIIIINHLGSEINDDMNNALKKKVNMHKIF